MAILFRLEEELKALNLLFIREEDSFLVISIAISVGIGILSIFVFIMRLLLPPERAHLVMS